MAGLPSVYPSVYHGCAAVDHRSKTVVISGEVTDEGDEGDDSDDIFAWFTLRNKQWLPRTADDDYDTDLEDAVGRVRDSRDSVYVYQTACKRHSVTACSSIINQLPGSKLTVANTGLGEDACLPLALALVINTTVSVLKLPNNDIGPCGIRHLARMLDANHVITHLDLSHNDIKHSGMKHLCRVLKNNDTLIQLNISGNFLQESDAKALKDALRHNNTLTHLNLSHNEFRELGGLSVGQLLAASTSLVYLDLSWNHLRLKGAAAIADGLKKNNSLQTLKLAWNGFANEGARAISVSLTENSSLQHLDLTCNRINVEGATSLGQTLKTNDTLLTLQLSKNPITTAGACFILHALRAGECSKLKRLELLDVEVNPEFRNLLQEIKLERDLEVVHGGHVSHDDPYAKREKKRQAAIAGDPLAILMEFVKQSSLRLMDLFAQFDKDNSWSVSRGEFKRGMKQAKVPLDDQQIDKLMDKLDTDKDGEINFAELLEGQRKYRERERKKIQQSMSVLLSRPSSARPSSARPGQSPRPRLRVSTLSMTTTLGTGSSTMSKLPSDEESGGNVNVLSLDVPSLSLQ